MGPMGQMGLMCWGERQQNAELTRNPRAPNRGRGRRRGRVRRRTPKRRTLNPLKPDLRSIDLGSALDKELFQSRRVKGTVLFRIHSQENLPARPEEPLLQIIEKERPLLWGPQIGALMAVEADGESSDHIESLTEIRQRFIGFDLPNHPL